MHYLVISNEVFFFLKMHRKKAILSFFGAPSDLFFIKITFNLSNEIQFSKFPKMTEKKPFCPDILKIDLFYSLCEKKMNK